MPLELAGLKVLLVEDTFLIADALTVHLTDEGCEVVGPFPSVEAAIGPARSAPLHGALLDINLGDGRSFPLAEVVRARKHPADLPDRVRP